MLWSCEQLSLFWKCVTKLIAQCLNVSVPLSTRLCLLGINMSDKWNKYESMYIDLALMAARKSIALKWKASKPPSNSPLVEWSLKLLCFGQHLILYIFTLMSGITTKVLSQCIYYVVWFVCFVVLSLFSLFYFNLCLWHFLSFVT